MAATAATLLVPSIHQAAAQQPAVGAVPTQVQSAGQNATRYKVAVVDISYIFKNYQRFKAMMDQMKTDVEAAEQVLSEERRKINQDAENAAATYKPGTPEFTREEERLTEVKTKFNLRMQKQRKEFLDREAKIYYQAYLEVNDAVKYYALRNDLGLVLRFNGDPIDPNDRQDVLRAINKPVVFQNGIDITPDVLRDLDRQRVPTQPVQGGVGGHQIPGQKLR